MRSSRTCIHLVLLASIIGMALLAWLPPSALALPPRPSAEPPPTRLPRSPKGAIELTVEGASAGLWTVVQWRDRLGGWHDVEGWQGTLDADGKKRWWVDRADLGKGPFRWAMTKGGDPVATSESFYLPDSPGEIVRVAVSLVP